MSFILVPLWIHEGNCIIGGLLKNPYTLLQNNQNNDDGDKSALHTKDVKISDIKTNLSVDLNTTRVAYYPHNDTIIVTYTCLSKDSLIKTKEIFQSRTCTFRNPNVSII